MWARCADVFSSEAAARLFGLISAGSAFLLSCVHVRACSLDHMDQCRHVIFTLSASGHGRRVDFFVDHSVLPSLHDKLPYSYLTCLACTICSVLPSLHDKLPYLYSAAGRCTGIAH